jgi:hypothetical protein
MRRWRNLYERAFMIPPARRFRQREYPQKHFSPPSHPGPTPSAGPLFFRLSTAQHANRARTKAGGWEADYRRPTTNYRQLLLIRRSCHCERSIVIPAQDCHPRNASIGGGKRRSADFRKSTTQVIETRRVMARAQRQGHRVEKTWRFSGLRVSARDHFGCGRAQRGPQWALYAVRSGLVMRVCYSLTE